MRHRESENGSIFQTALVFVRMNKPTIGRYKMKVSSKAIVNGEFEDKYGKRGSQFSPSGMPSYSIPFEIEDAPEGTKSFAVVLEDKDAISASGFVWTHWLISDLKRTSVAENESISATDSHRVRILGRAHWVNLKSKRLLFTAVWRHRTTAIVMS